MPDVSFSSLGAVSAGTAAAFVAAGLLSALIFAVASLALLRTGDTEPEPGADTPAGTENRGPPLEVM
jgi:hypothetical protein